MSSAESIAALLQRFQIPACEGESKIMPLSDAVHRYLRPGMTVHVGYSTARPNAAQIEMVRQFAGTDSPFTLVTAGLASVQHALIASGVVNHVIAAFAGENYPAPAPNPIFQEAIRSGKVTIENWSLWSLIARLVGGALGTSFFPVHSLKGSGMEKEHLGKRFFLLPDPLHPGETVGVVASLRPDVTLVQGVAADPYGNVVMSAPYGETSWGSLAAKEGVIACVERIVDTKFLQAHSALVKIPGHVVKAVCHVPLGSHPYGLYNPGLPGISGHVEDHDFIVELQQVCRKPERFQEWIDEWIHGTADHRAYLGKLGRERVFTLMGKGQETAWELEASPDWLATNDPAFNDEEMMVVASARKMIERTRHQGYRAVLAGVGYSNLAAWLACTLLKESGYDVELMAEIGMFGYSPKPGEPFIFSNRNLPTCKMMTDVMGVLGTLVSGSANQALGAVGAGHVDKAGNVNSTYTSDGTFLVGSGGANDIASAAQEVVITVSHSKRRLVDKVPYITMPGERIKTIVTSLAIFERDEEGFVLTGYLPAAGITAAEAVAKIQEGCSWHVRVAPNLKAEPPATPDELQLIRLFDPKRTFLGPDPRKK
jgi:acyl CoA:acetate/3-ketoacid CoA transferase alpha subunit/acyl CoA:acetate/3-ketoacid CoA transferase beta subunit